MKQMMRGKTPFLKQKVIVPLEGGLQKMTVEDWARKVQGLTYREIYILQRHESNDGIC